MLLWPARLLCRWGFSRREYWRGLPFPSAEDLLTQRTNPDLHYRQNFFFFFFFFYRRSHQVLQPSGLKFHLAVFCCSEAARCGTQESGTGRELEKPTESEAGGALRRGGVWTSASVPQSALLPESPALRRLGEDPGAPQLPGLRSAAGSLELTSSVAMLVWTSKPELAIKQV